MKWQCRVTSSQISYTFLVAGLREVDRWTRPTSAGSQPGPSWPTRAQRSRWAGPWRGSITCWLPSTATPGCSGRVCCPLGNSSVSTGHYQYCEIIFIRWISSFVYFVCMLIQEFKIPTKYLLTIVIFYIIWNPRIYVSTNMTILVKPRHLVPMKFFYLTSHNYKVGWHCLPFVMPDNFLG